MHCHPPKAILSLRVSYASDQVSGDLSLWHEQDRGRSLKGGFLEEQGSYAWKGKAKFSSRKGCAYLCIKLTVW